MARVLGMVGMDISERVFVTGYINTVTGAFVQSL